MSTPPLAFLYPEKCERLPLAQAGLTSSPRGARAGRPGRRAASASGRHCCQPWLGAATAAQASWRGTGAGGVRSGAAWRLGSCVRFAALRRQVKQPAAAMRPVCLVAPADAAALFLNLLTPKLKIKEIVAMRSCECASWRRPAIDAGLPTRCQSVINRAGVRRARRRDPDGDLKRHLFNYRSTLYQFLDCKFVNWRSHGASRQAGVWGGLGQVVRADWLPPRPAWFGRCADGEGRGSRT